MIQSGRSKKKSNTKVVGVPLGAVVYRGPTRLPQEQGADDLVVTQLNFYGSITTSAGGVINSVIDSNSQLTSSADWASLQNIYAEYRVLSMEVTFEPWNKFNQPTTDALAPVISITSRDTNTALASSSAASAYASAEIHSPSTAIKREIKMGGTSEAQFYPVATAPAVADRLYVKLYSAGNANSKTVYDYLTRLVVQFRGRQ